MILNTTNLEIRRSQKMLIERSNTTLKIVNAKI